MWRWVPHEVWGLDSMSRTAAAVTGRPDQKGSCCTMRGGGGVPKSWRMGASRRRGLFGILKMRATSLRTIDTPGGSG